jgi:hypothetical protein
MNPNMLKLIYSINQFSQKKTRNFKKFEKKEDTTNHDRRKIYLQHLIMHTYDTQQKAVSHTKNFAKTYIECN